MIAKQLQAAGLRCFPCWVRYNPQTGHYDKGPSVPKGLSWQDVQQDDPTLDWSAPTVGVPIPEGVVVLDLDTYKGITRADVEAWLGAPIDWDRAAIQRTIGGGEHYAFSCSWDVRQLQGPQGLDTRVAGKGFICTGQGYSPLGVAGVFALARPSLLPSLPDAARSVLAPPLPPQRVTPAAQADDAEVIDALRHIDPGCPRADWVRVGLALRHQYDSDPHTGMMLFGRWSSGEFWPGGMPSNYVHDHIEHQWGSFKPEGGTTIATLYYRAIQGGWTPPTALDTAAAFSPGDSEAFDNLLQRVRSDGGNVKNTPEIIENIKSERLSPLQVALLAAELKTELAHSGVKDRSVSGHIDTLLRAAPPEPPTEPGMYGKYDTENARTFLGKFYPDNTLARCDGEFYVYTGKIWQKRTAETIKHQLAVDMCSQLAQDSRVTSAFRTITNLSPVLDGQLNTTPPNLIIFDNGMLDINTSTLYAHDKTMFSTNLLPYPWTPGAQCPQWVEFLRDILDDDQERIDLLQEWMGYLMSRDYSHQKIMFLLGAPRCGKGTIGRVMHHVLGAQNFSGGSLSSLANDSYIDGISEKGAVFVGDAQKRVSHRLINEVIERMKAISGNDEISWHRMYYGAISRTLPTRFTLAANNVPALFDDSGALASRLLLITFNKSYLGKEDLTLTDRLLAEIPGIAAWAIDGLNRLRARGAFTQPEACEEERKYIQENYSPIDRFITDMCEVHAEARCSSVEMYNVYRAWCIREGVDLLKRNTFVGALKDATRGKYVRYGAHRMDGEVCRGFKGITPRQDAPSNADAFTPKFA